jgi:hypothetical protein
LVINGRNKKIKELYCFENGAVYLVGYISEDYNKSYTRFVPPLIILPSIEANNDISISNIQTWNKKKSVFDDGIKTKSCVKLLRHGKISLENNKEEFYEYETTISRDVKINYGEQGLLVPEAIILKSNIVYTKSSGIIAEWGIRTIAKDGETEQREKEVDAYVELTKYFIIKR